MKKKYYFFIIALYFFVNSNYAKADYAATPNYSCPSGGILSGTICVTSSTTPASAACSTVSTDCPLDFRGIERHGNFCYTACAFQFSCPISWAVSSSYITGAPICYAPNNPHPLEYSCTTGTLSGQNCVSSSSYNAIVNYSCPSGGTLSGTTCVVAVPPTACSLPWGGTLASGTSIKAYSTSSVACGLTCTEETRTCNNGTLSGSYTNSTCTPDVCVPTLTMSLAAVPASGDSPLTTHITATLGGTATGTPTYSNRSCGGGILSNVSTAGDSFDCYYGVAGTYYPSTYVSKSAFPSDVFASTTVTVTTAALSPCSIPASLGGGTLASGSSITAYASDSLNCGACVSESRLCTNGILAGVYMKTISTCAIPCNPTNGVCGSANGIPKAVAPSTGLCAPGSSTPVTKSGSNWTWICKGLNGGSDSPTCSATVLPPDNTWKEVPVN